MHPRSAGDSATIVCQEKRLTAATCKSCGAKIYPKSLLRPHRNLHQRRQQWFLKQLGELHHSFAQAQDFA